MCFLYVIQQFLFYNMAKHNKEAGSLEYLCVALPDFPYGFVVWILILLCILSEIHFLVQSQIHGIKSILV